jgi:hypothetical protein
VLKSGSVEFTVFCKFPAANTVTGLHIHKGAAGVAGGIVIPTDVNATTNAITVDATGASTINKQVQFGTAAGQPDVAIIADLLANPANYYVNIHTTDFPSGAMRSQLLPATGTVLMAQMSPANEVPPIANSKASAIASVHVLRAQDSGGNLLAGVVTFDANYTGFPTPPRSPASTFMALSDRPALTRASLSTPELAPARLPSRRVLVAQGICITT